jgi:hypothetical protein
VSLKKLPLLLLRCLFEIVVIVATIITLFWPHDIANRPLYPSDMVAALSKKTEVEDPIYSDSSKSGHYKLLIDASVAEVGAKLSTLELISQKPLIQDNRAKGFPHRYTKTIGIEFSGQEFVRGASKRLSVF